MMNLWKRDRDFLDNLFDDFNVGPFFKNDPLMKTDILETDHGYELAIELPGFEKDQVKVSLENGYLHIEAVRDETKETKDKYLRRERFYGQVERKFYVGDLSLNDIEGSFDKGVLKLILPKEENKQVESKKYLELK